jgi:WD40 repeat protein
MTDKDRLRHLLDLAAEEIPETVNLWHKIRAKAAQSPAFEDEALGTLRMVPRIQPSVAQRSRSRSFSVMSFAMVSAILILGGLVLLNNRAASDKEEPLYAGFPIGTEASEIPASSLKMVSQVGRGKAVEALWSPDGQQMFVAGSSGIWVYDAADLSEPIENIYPEISFTQAPVFSQDSRHLAFLNGGSAHIWDLREGRDITIDLLRDMTRPQSIALTPDASIMVVGDQNGTVHFYDVQTQKLLSSARIIDSVTPILTVEFDAQGTSLALFGQSVSSSLFLLEDLTGQWNGELQAGELEAVALPVDPTHEAPLGTVAYSGDRSHIVGRFGNSLVVWAWDGQILRRTNWIDSINGEGRLVMNQDGSQVAHLSQDMWVWSLASDSIALTSRIPGTDLPWTGVMNFNPDWSQISMVDSLGYLQVKDMATGREIMATDSYTMGCINGIAFTSDGAQMVTNDETGQIRVWETAMLTDIPAPFIIATRAIASETQSTAMTVPAEMSRPPGTIQPAAMAEPMEMSQESRLALPSVFGTDEKIELWNLTAEGGSALAARVNSVWPLPAEFLNGTFTAAGTTGVPLIIALDETGAVAPAPAPAMPVDPLTLTLETVVEQMTANALNPDGYSVAVALALGPAQAAEVPGRPIIVIYDATTGQPITRLSAHDATIRSLVYSPDGTQLLSSAEDGSLKLWDLASGTVLHTFVSQGAYPAAFSRDGALIAAIDAAGNSSGSDLVLWDAATGDLVLRISTPTLIERVIFYPDGKHLVTGSANGIITFWKLNRS